MPLDIRPRDVVILSAVRTAFGTQNGALARVTATELAVPTATAAMAAAGVEPGEVDHVIYGNVLQTANDAIYLARHVGLRAGVPERVPALTVNRLCGSGFQAIITAAEQVLTGQASVVLCGGTENMSMAPHVVHGLRDGVRFGNPPKLQDLLWECLMDTYGNLPMAMTAENVGARYGITREAADAFAATSQERWAAADEAGRFRDEIVPVTLEGRKGKVVFDRDEHPRPTRSDYLAQLRPVFKADGLVTAGNASGICDGAASLVVADATWAERRGLSPLARLVGWGVSGCDPQIMGIGPVPASRRALEVTGLGLHDMDLVEINEAFAAQYLAVEAELGLDRARTNVNGGAIALGHPLGTTGARLTGALIHELRRRRARYGLASACIGGGQGIAVVVEAFPSSASDLRREVLLQAAAILGTTADAVPQARPLGELGLDSIKAVELRDKLAATVGHALPVSFLFDHPTVEDIVSRLNQLAAAPAAPSGPPEPAPEADVDAASSEELLKLLGSELDKLDG